MHGWCICKAQTPMTQHVTKEEILELFSREISPEMITLLDTKLSQLKLGDSSDLGRRLVDTDRPGTAGKVERAAQMKKLMMVTVMIHRFMATTAIRSKLRQKKMVPRATQMLKLKCEGEGEKILKRLLNIITVITFIVPRWKICMCLGRSTHVTA